MFRVVPRVLLSITLAVSVWACQSPTSPSDLTTADEAVDVTFNPNPVHADASRGQTYRIPRNNEPDEIREYPWEAVFVTTVSLNSKATSRDIDLKFPVKVTSVTLSVRQASGGIVTPPTGGETEKYEYVTLSATGNQFGAVGEAISLTFQGWYDLPSRRREALIAVNMTFVDTDGRGFAKSAEVTVAP